MRPKDLLNNSERVMLVRHGWNLENSLSMSKLHGRYLNDREYWMVYCLDFYKVIQKLVDAGAI